MITCGNGPKLIVMQGLPGSGKSSLVSDFAKYGGFQVICRDDLRIAHGQEERGWSPELEEEVTASAKIMFKAFLARGLNIILDETNTKPKSFVSFAKEAKDAGYYLKLVRMTTPLEICALRRLEDGKCPPEAIRRMHENLETNFPLSSLTTHWGDLFDSIMLRSGV